MQDKKEFLRLGGTVLIFAASRCSPRTDIWSTRSPGGSEANYVCLPSLDFLFFEGGGGGEAESKGEDMGVVCEILVACGPKAESL